jgi:hypothetical protein
LTETKFLLKSYSDFPGYQKKKIQTAAYKSML